MQTALSHDIRSAILLGSKGQAASHVEKKSVAVEHNIKQAVILSQVLTISEILESWIWLRHLQGGTKICEASSL